MSGLTGGFGGINMGGGGGAGAPAPAPSQMMPSMNVWGDAPASFAQIPQVQARPAQQQQPAMQSNVRSNPLYITTFLHPGLRS
jgi:hypothetical protein